jgi:hypothetical protein
MRTSALAPLAPLLLVTLASLALASPALAHEREAQHRAIVSARVDQGALLVEALLLMELPSGRRATALIQRADLDRSGTLDALESRLVSSELGPEVVGGYVLRLGEAALVPQEVEEKATVSESGGVLVALLLRYRAPLDKLPGRLAAQILERPAGQGTARARPMMIELQASPPLRLRGASAPRAKDAPVVGPVLLRPAGSAAWIEIAVEKDP